MKKRMLRGCLSAAMALCMVLSTFTTVGAVPSVSPSEYLQQQENDTDSIKNKELFKLSLSKSVLDMANENDSVDVSVWINSEALDKGSIEDITYYADGKQIGKGNKISFRPEQSNLHFVNDEATLNLFAVCKYEDGTGDRTNIEQLKVLQGKQTQQEEFKLSLSKSVLDLSKGEDSVDASVMIKSYDTTKGAIKEITYYSNGKVIGTGKKVTYKPSEDDLHFMNGEATLSIFAVCKYEDGTGNRTNIETLKVLEASSEVKEEFILAMSKSELDMSQGEDSVDLSVTVKGADTTKGPIKDIVYYADGKEIGKGRKITYKLDKDSLHFMEGVAKLNIFAVCKYGDGTGNRTNIEVLTIKEDSGSQAKEEFTLKLSKSELDMSKGEDSVDLSVAVKGADTTKGPIKDITYYADGKEIGKGMKMTYKPDADSLHFMDGVAKLNIFAVCKYGDGTGNRTNIEVLKVTQGSASQSDNEEFDIELSKTELDMSQGEDSVDISVNIKGSNKDKGPIKEITYYADGKEIGTGRKITYTIDEDSLHFMDGVAKLNIFAVCKYGDGTGNRTNIEVLKITQGSSSQTEEKFTLKLVKSELDLSKGENSVGISVVVSGTNPDKGPIKEITYYADGKEIGKGNRINYTIDPDSLHFMDGVAKLNIFAVCKYGDGTGNRTNIEVLKVKEGTGSQTTEEDFEIVLSKSVLDLEKGETSVDVSTKIVSYDESKGSIKDITYYANGKEIGKGIKLAYKPDVKDLHFVDGQATLSIFAVCKYEDGTGNRTNIATLKVLEGSSEVKDDFRLTLSKTVLDMAQGEDSVDLSVTIKGTNTDKGPIKTITYYANGDKIGTGRKVTFKPSDDILHFVNGEATLSIFAVCQYGDGTGDRTNIETLKVKQGEVVKKEDFKISVSKNSIDMGSSSKSISISAIVNSSDADKGPITDITYYANGTVIGTGRKITYTPSEDVLHFVNGEATLSIFAVLKYADGTGDRTDIATVKVKEAKETPTQPPVRSDLALSVSGDNALQTSTIGKKFTIRNNGNESIDLTKVKLRYYFTKDSNVSQNFYCDNAAMNLNTAPWYIDASSYVQGKIVNESGNSCYLEISFRSGVAQLPQGNAIEIQTRLANSDWSMQDQSNDYSNKGADCVVMMYQDDIVWGSAPSK